jgi:RNA binding exosome subunit
MMPTITAKEEIEGLYGEIDVLRSRLDALQEIRDALDTAVTMLAQERDALRKLLATARRKIPFLVRDYPGDKESREWIELCDDFMRRSWEIK